MYLRSPPERIAPEKTSALALASSRVRRRSSPLALAAITDVASRPRLHTVFAVVNLFAASASLLSCPTTWLLRTSGKKKGSSLMEKEMEREPVSRWEEEEGEAWKLSTRW